MRKKARLGVLVWGLSAPMTGVVCGLAVAAAIVTVGHDASARSSYDSNYGYERTWNAALRLVRVDLGFKVTEKDQEDGYLLFEYRTPEAHGASPGSIELVRGKDADGPVEVIVQLPQMPRYHEQVLVDSLARKMQKEYGDPPAHAPHPPEPQDGGTD
jgi:hypothetical protein